jgi:hypothetical protein
LDNCQLWLLPPDCYGLYGEEPNVKVLKWLFGLVLIVLAAIGAFIAWKSIFPGEVSAVAFEGEAKATLTESEVRTKSPAALIRGLGERCSNDCQCESRECKGFKCIARDYNQHPLLNAGQKCRFKGDCSSCDCQMGTCN